MIDWNKTLSVDNESDDDLAQDSEVDFFALDDASDEETSEEITSEDDSEEDDGLSLFGEVEEEENLEEEENFGERLLADWRKGHEELMQSLDDQRAELQAKIDEIKLQRGMK